MRLGSSAFASLLLGLAASPAAAQELGHRGATSLIAPEGAKLVAAPSDEDVMAATPRGSGPAGSAVVACQADASGRLADCRVSLERGSGFGSALLSLAPKYRVDLTKSSGEGTDVIIAASWPAPDTPADWAVTPKAGDFAITYTDAAWRSGKPGYAVMNCQQGRLGDLRQCVAVYQSPPGKGFGKMLLAFQA
jgi:hypothetical protein